MDNDGLEARLTLLEIRVASLETRQAILESQVKAVKKPRTRRELTPEEKKVVRERLSAGQEKARAKKA